MPLRLLHYADLETALDEPEQCARLAGELAARRDGDTVVVGSGDDTAPGALSMATGGRAALDVFEAVDPDVETFGNHDFDFGPDVARDLAAAAPQPWLCANATRDGSRFAAGVTEPSTVVETEGYRVGVVGVGHPETGTINPAADDVRFSDPVPAVREEAAALRERGVDHLVVASHCGTGDERIARETDVDAVLGGHVHDVHVETVDGTFVVRPGRAGRYLAEVTLDGGADVAVHEVTRGDGRTSDGDADRPFDRDLATTLRERLDAAGLTEVVAHVEDPIERTEETVTVAESRIGNVVADAQCWKTGADLAISPPGTVRAGDPLAGEITVAELHGLTPYRDRLALVELSGDRLRETLREVPRGYHHEGCPTRHCSHVSGTRVVWDDDAGDLTAGTVVGEPIDPDRTYRLAIADYMVETDHVIETVDVDDVVAYDGLVPDAIVEYAREVGIAPAIDGRIQRPALER